MQTNLHKEEMTRSVPLNETFQASPMMVKSEPRSIRHRSEAERLILRRGWLADQPAELQRAVLSRARLIEHGTGEFLHHVGDEPGGIHGIVSGAVGIHVPLAGGELLLAHVATCGTWFGYGPLLRSGRRSLTISVIEEASLFSLALSDAQSIARQSPEFQRSILTIGEYGMDIAVATIACLLLRRPDQRIAATLVRLDATDPDATGILRVTQSMLGEMANVDRRLVNRILRSMAESGAVAVAYRQITVLNRAMLTAIAQSA